MSINEINNYLSGKKLFGDDFTEDQIMLWYEEEKNAYAGLVDTRESYAYEYHALNELCAYNFFNLSSKSSIRACAFGSAFGDELDPIRDKLASVVLIDSAASFHEKIFPNEVSTILADPSGRINCKDGSFDLITCLGVLHHIPNVSFVMSEFYRCLDRGGVLMVREPTTTMGDWRFPRKGVTKNERGIPRTIFKNIILNAGFEILKCSPCVYPPLSTIFRKLGISPYNSKLIVLIDLVLSYIFKSNYSYHRMSLKSKFAPASEFYVCKKV